MTRDSDDIVDRGLHCPLFAGGLETATHRGDSANSTCNDRVHFDVEIKNDVIVAMSHTCQACVVTAALADFLCEAAIGKAPSEVKSMSLFELMGISILPARRECIHVVGRAFDAAFHI